MSSIEKCGSEFGRISIPYLQLYGKQYLVLYGGNKISIRPLDEKKNKFKKK